jgi:hypothetical protein
VVYLKYSRVKRFAWREKANMNETLLSIGIVVFIVYAVFSIVNTIEMRRTSIALRQLIVRSEEDLRPALAALRGILEDIGTTTDNVAVLTQSLRGVADTAARVEHTVNGLYEYYRESLGEAARANIAGLKAGVKAGVVTLLKDLNDRKEGSS